MRAETTPKLVKAATAEVDDQSLRADIAALRARVEATRRTMRACVKQIEQLDEQAAQIEARLQAKKVVGTHMLT